MSRSTGSCDAMISDAIFKVAVSAAVHSWLGVMTGFCRSWISTDIYLLPQHSGPVESEQFDRNVIHLSV